MDATNFVNTKIDLGQVRLNQDFTNEFSAKKKILSIPVKKPSKNSFFKVRSVSDDYSLRVALLEFKEESATYLLDPKITDLISESVSYKILYLCIDRKGNLFFWPIKIQGEDGGLDSWNASAHEAVQVGLTTWIRIASNKSDGRYDTYEALGELEEAEWPDLTLEELIYLAFKDKYISTESHQVIQKLRGIK